MLDRKIYKSAAKTVIRGTFQGQIAENRHKDTNEVISTTRSPFFHLTLDLPKQETLLVEGKQGRHTQVSLQSLLLKYNASGSDGGGIRTPYP